MKPPETLSCVDCDGTAYLLEQPPPPPTGGILSYRCDSCWERFDVVWEDQEEDEEDAAGGWRLGGPPSR